MASRRNHLIVDRVKTCWAALSLLFRQISIPPNLYSLMFHIAMCLRVLRDALKFHGGRALLQAKGLRLEQL